MEPTNAQTLPAVPTIASKSVQEAIYFETSLMMTGSVMTKYRSVPLKKEISTPSYLELPPSDRTVGCLLMEAADELTG